MNPPGVKRHCEKSPIVAVVNPMVWLPRTFVLASLRDAVRFLVDGPVVATTGQGVIEKVDRANGSSVCASIKVVPGFILALEGVGDAESG